MPKQEISVGTFGPAVRELHSQLLAHGFHVPESEVGRDFFGPATRAAVRTAQERHGLAPTGAADAPTRTAIGADRPARAATTAEETPAAAPVPNATPPASEDRPAGKSERPGGSLVRGQVRYRDGLPIGDLTVRLARKRLREEERIGEAATDATGRYEITYSFEEPPDLVVRVFDPASPDVVLVQSPVVFAAGPVEKVILLVDGGPATTWSEYEQLVTELDPLLHGLAIEQLTEDESNADVSLLAGQTGQEPQRIVTLVQSHRLAAVTGLPAAVFYGFARQNLSAGPARAARAATEVQRAALESAIAANIIPGRLLDSLDEILAGLQALIAQYAVAPPSESVGGSLGPLLETTLPGRRGADAVHAEVRGAPRQDRGLLAGPAAGSRLRRRRRRPPADAAARRAHRQQRSRSPGRSVRCGEPASSSRSRTSRG